MATYLQHPLYSVPGNSAYIHSYFNLSTMVTSGGAVASWLVRWTPEQALRVWALAGDIVLCS